MMMWLAVPDLAGLPGMPGTERGALKKAKASNWTSRPRSGRGRAGHEYLVTSLPPETQQALALRAVAVAGETRALTRAVNAGLQAQEDQRSLRLALSLAQNGQQLQMQGLLDAECNPRLDLFQRFDRYHQALGITRWAAIQAFCLQWNAGQVDAHPGTRAAFPRLTEKSLDRWLRDWRNKGAEAALPRKQRRDKGQTALVKDEALYQAFVSAVSEMHAPTARQVCRVIRTETGKDVPARTVQTWLAEFRANNQAVLLKLKNPDGWRNKFMPAFGSRSEHVEGVNDEWQMDSTIADAQQRVEIAFNLMDGETGEIRRHALVAVIDVFTRRAEVLVARTSSANAVKAVFRRFAMKVGKPNRTKTDNGKDYTAQDFDFGLQALQVEHVLCTPFSPDQKPFIERFLGTLLHDLFPMLPGFVGKDVAERKAIESAKSFAQRFGDQGITLHMTPERLQGVIDDWLHEYHNRIHSELGCAPNEMADRHTTHVVRVDERALDLFMMPVAGKGLRQIGKKGISLDRAFYAAPELAPLIGETVYCRVDETDLGALHVFSLGGDYICRALDHTRLGINRAELAAKARQIESATVKPMLDQLRRASRRGLTAKAVAALHAERQDSTVDAASNVHRMPVRAVAADTPAITSVLDVLGGQQAAADRLAEQRAAARAALDEQDAAPVQRMDTPRQRYSAWVRLSARMAAEESISARDARWHADYGASSECQAWHAMQQGADPLAGVGG